MRNVNLDDYYARQQGRKRQYEGANVRFELVIEQDEAATERAGGIPKYVEKEVLIVQWPGCDKTAVAVTEKHKEEYRELYQAFKAGNEQPTEGTALSEWALIPRTAVEELRYHGIRTVEQLAAVSDEVKRKIGSLAPLVKKAKTWLKGAEDPQNQLVTVTEQLERSEARSAKLEQQLSLALQRIEALEGNKLT